MGALAVGERSWIWRAGGAGSARAIEGRVVVVWGAAAAAIGSVRVAVVGVGVGWAELRIAVLVRGSVSGWWCFWPLGWCWSGSSDLQATERFGAGSVYLVRFGRGLPGWLGASW